MFRLHEVTELRSILLLVRGFVYVALAAWLVTFGEAAPQAGFGLFRKRIPWDSSACYARSPSRYKRTIVNQAQRRQTNVVMKTKSLPADIFFEVLHKGGNEPLRRKPVLIICDNEECGDTVAQIVRKRSVETVCCLRLSDALSLLLEQTFSAVFCSDILPDGDYSNVIRSAGSTPVVVFSRIAEWDRYLDAVHRGAFDYTRCPPDFAEIERILEIATTAPRMDQPNR